MKYGAIHGEEAHLILVYGNYMGKDMLTI